MLRAGSLCLLLLGTAALGANAQDLALDLRVQPGPVPGSVSVELFPGNLESASFVIRIRSADGEQLVATQTRVTTIPGLLSGSGYHVSAVGLGRDTDVTETSPEESILVP